MDNSTDKWHFCPLCSHPFTSTPNTTVDGVAVPDSDEDDVRNLVIPVPSVACSHLLCLSCLQQHQQTFNNDTGNLTASAFVPCPICSEEDAFLIKNCKPSSVLCELLKTVQEQSLQNQEQTIQIIELQDILKTVQESKFEERKDECENFASNNLEEDFLKLDEARETFAGQDKGEEGTLILTDNGNQGAQQPTVSIANGTHQPGAYPIPGIQMNSNNINDGLESGLADISNDNIVHAYVVEPTPTPVVAFAEPLVSFFEKYRWPLRGLVVAAIVATIVALAITIPTVRRTKSLTSIALGISNQTSLDLLGGPQKMAFDWILGRTNAKFDPSKDQAQIQQRYILATLFYSTGGFDWNQTGNMLSSDDECAWLEQAINCTSDGSVAIIQLGKLSIDMYCMT